MFNSSKYVLRVVKKLANTALVSVLLLTVYISSAHVEIQSVGATSQISPTVLDTTKDASIVPIRIYLPLVINPPKTPTLNPINNQDQDNYFTVTWQNNGIGETYILEESIDPSFSNPIRVYQGPSLTWAVPDTGKLPATYYYRAKATGATGESGWSDTQSVTIYPLFVGLSVRWDGAGYVRGYYYYDIGWHGERVLDMLTEPDTIRSNNHNWYDPDPLGFGPEYYYSYYSVTTGQWKASSIPGDPSWKWGYSWKLDYDSQFTNGENVTINGQKFTVTGPHAGYTTWGKTIWYWEFVNQDKFLIWDGGGDWKQYVHAGDAILRYDAGNSLLLIYDNILRRYYYQGGLTSDTVQYIINLTSANSIPDSPQIETSIEVQEESQAPIPPQYPFYDSLGRNFISSDNIRISRDDN